MFPYWIHYALIKYPIRRKQNVFKLLLLAPVQIFLFIFVIQSK